MASKICMNPAQTAELAKAIAQGLASNPEFIKVVVNTRSAYHIADEIADCTKEAVQNIAML